MIREVKIVQEEDVSMAEHYTNEHLRKGWTLVSGLTCEHGVWRAVLHDMKEDVPPAPETENF